MALLALHTTLASNKQLREVSGRCTFANAAVRGYEIHLGESHGPALSRPAFDLGQRHEGAISDDGQILGTYLHGVFDDPEACQALLQWAGLDAAPSVALAELREQSLERLADAMQEVMTRLQHGCWP